MSVRIRLCFLLKLEMVYYSYIFLESFYDFLTKDKMEGLPFYRRNGLMLGIIILCSRPTVVCV